MPFLSTRSANLEIFALWSGVVIKTEGLEQMPCDGAPGTCLSLATATVVILRLALSTFLCILLLRVDVAVARHLALLVAESRFLICITRLVSTLMIAHIILVILVIGAIPITSLVRIDIQLNIALLRELLHVDSNSKLI